MKHLSFFLFLLCLLPFQVMAQNETLLTINNQPILLSEFERVYHKNNNVEGYENKSPAEYLEMFINFKLKVLEANQLGFDTASAFINELAGYRDQLSKPYLQDRNLIDQLIKEAYERTVTEVNASHIMVKIKQGASSADSIAAYEKAVSIRNRLLAGESFEKIAREESDDPSGKINGGNLGWFSAFTMVYPFENAAYNTPLGSFSQPVKSKYGYHIIKVNNKRPALGEIKLAHIMIRTEINDNLSQRTLSKQKADSCYDQLKKGTPFVDMVNKYSDDMNSKRNGGQMRWLRSGELPSDLENAVFALKDSGEFTEPLQSDYGWHIFQLLSKRPIAPFDKLKAELEERLMMDERGKLTEEAFIKKLKAERSFIAFPENISMITDAMDSSVYSGKWIPANMESFIEPVFRIDSTDYSQKSLIELILKAKRFNKKESYSDIVNRKFDELARKELLSYEKLQLESKYPAFRYLMEEYHDGILLFNIMDEKVWGKAIRDTVGLKAYFDQHRDDYTWKERADVSVYTVTDPAYIKPATKYARQRITEKWNADQIRRLVCKSDSIQCVTVTDFKIEQGEASPIGDFTWKKGFIKTFSPNGNTKILVVNEIIPPTRKNYEETLGQLTADYQNDLDKKWIDSLRSKYTIIVNQDVLKQVK